MLSHSGWPWPGDIDGWREFSALAAIPAAAQRASLDERFYRQPIADRRRWLALASIDSG